MPRSHPLRLLRPLLGRALLGALVLLLALSWVADQAMAQGDMKASCSDSYVANQKLRKQGKFTAARQQLINCAQEGCPGPIKTDCVRWLAELERNLPTFVVAAQSPDGSDLVNVRVFVDGVKVAAQLDGRPLPIDPGVHKVRIEHDGMTPIDKQVVIQQGMKNRAISVRFEPAGASPPVAPNVAPVGGIPPGSTDPSPDDPGRGDDVEKPIPVAVIVVLGVLSAGAFASFAGFGITGMNEADELDNRCGQNAPDPNDRGTCSPPDVDDVRTKLIVADVSLGVGIASFVVGLTLLLYNEVGNHERAKTSGSFGVMPTEDGAFAAAGWHF